MKTDKAKITEDMPLISVFQAEIVNDYNIIYHIQIIIIILEFYM